MRRAICGLKSRPLSTGAAWRKTRLRKPSGSEAGAGREALSISTGMTGMFFASAASTSMRTQSFSSFILKLPLSLGAAQRAPTMASSRSQRFSVSLDVLAEIEPERDRVDVHEHLIGAVMPDQAIEDASGDRAGVVPAIGEDDGWHAKLRPRRNLAERA